MTLEDPFAPLFMPTSRKPLLGMTVLVVEDSRFAGDALRLMCLHSGARIRRADCLQSARRHLCVYRPSVAIIDLGLPDGSGLDLIRDLSQQRPRVSVLLGISGDESASLLVRRAGADGFLSKPLSNLATFQEMVLRHMPEDLQPAGPRRLNEERIEPDPAAYVDDMMHLAALLEDNHAEESLIDYVAQFVDSLARTAGDTALLEAADALRMARHSGGDVRSAQTCLAELAALRIKVPLAV